MAKAKHEKELQEFILSKNWTKLVNSCEEYELEPSDVPNYGVHLLSYYFVGDMDNARFLWKRIPISVKSTKPEFLAIWKIGQALWGKKYADIYATTNSFTWTEPHKTLIGLFLDSFREKTFNLISRAYTAISLSDASVYLGLPSELILKSASERGWGFDKSTNILSPVAITQLKEQSTSLTQLQQLTDYFCYLEGQ